MSCGSGIYDICLFQSTSYSLPITFSDDDGLPIDISTWSGRAPIAHNYGGKILSNFDLNFSAGNSGILILSIDETGTAALPVSQLIYQVQLYPNSESVVRYLWGYVNVSPSI